MTDLENILKYNMNELEAKAYKVSLLWQELSRKEFPDYQHVRLRKSGDPRKSLLFRYCYKLVKETQGLIDDREYKHYVTAQLHVLKSVTDGTVHALIDPQCLVGDKAWRRWKLWKSRFEKQIAKKIREEEVELQATKARVVGDLQRTQEFLTDKLGENWTQEQIARTLKERLMIKWITLSQVSPYYAILSPYLKESLGGKKLEDVFLFELDVYKKTMPSGMTEEFERIFHES